MIQDIAWSPRLVGTTTATAASAADVTVGTSTSTFVTPAALAGSSPTIGGNLTVSGTGNSTFAGNLQVSGLIGHNSVAGDLDIYSGNGTGTEYAVNLYSRNSSNDAWIKALVAKGTSTTIAGNLTVSGTGTSNVGGTLVVGSTSAASGSGKLELATHTTSAGGIGFGTDLSLYRANTGFLILNDASAALDARIGLYNNGTQRGLFEAYNVGTAVYMGAASAGWSTIITSGNQATALTLDSSQNATFAGNVSISGSGTGSTNALYVTNSTPAVAFRVQNDGYITTGALTNSPYNNTTGSAANLVVDSGGGISRSTSSIKYKNDVQDAVYGLADVLKLRAVTYKGKNDGDKIFGGLIAEEVHAAGLTQFVQYAPDGSPDALAYGNMISVFVNAIKELNARIIRLENA
jgi:hypothetical protein